MSCLFYLDYPMYEHLGCGPEPANTDCLLRLGATGTTPHHLLEMCASLMSIYHPEERVFYIKEYTGQYWCCHSDDDVTESDVTSSLLPSGDCTEGFGNSDAALYIYRE